MNARPNQDAGMSLIAYHLLTEHGFALPLFAASSSANALHAATPSRPDDPAATIIAFDLYDSDGAIMLDSSLHRTASAGDDWLDVFLWEGSVHVGKTSDLWLELESARDAIGKQAPLTLLALADGGDRAVTVSCAVAAHDWLARTWGAEHADKWRLYSWMPRLLARNLRKYFEDRLDLRQLTVLLKNAFLDLRQPTLELRLPAPSELLPDDLPDLAAAASGFGWHLDVIPGPAAYAKSGSVLPQTDRVLVMRLRHGRGRTQTQIPLRLIDEFFGPDRKLHDRVSDRTLAMTLSRSGERRNTMKLQLPEMARMADPVARFVRGVASMEFEVYDASSKEGKVIADLLEDGLHNGTTHKTSRGATWWRFLPV